MQFNDTTNDQGLVQDIDFWVGTSENSYPLKDKTRSINQWLHRVIGWIMQADGEWEYDDPAHGEWPSATKDLVAGTSEYALPAAFTGADQNKLFKIIRVEVLKADGDYANLNKVPYNLIRQAIDEWTNDDNGLPNRYLITGDRIKLDVPPSATDVTLSKGLKFYLQRAGKEFTAASTTQQPPFAPQFHRVLSLGAGYDYAKKQGIQDKKAELRGEIGRLKLELTGFYGNRMKDRNDSKQRIMPVEINSKPPI